MIGKAGGSSSFICPISSLPLTPRHNSCFEREIPPTRTKWHNSELEGVRGITMLENGTTQMRLAAHTLGCKLNYSETTTITKQFADRGFSVVPLGGVAEVVLLNTCSVTENAERECRHLVRRALRNSPDAFVIVTGCYAQLRPEEIASIPGVDLVLGAQEKFRLFEHLTGFEKNHGPKIFATEISDEAEFHAAASPATDGRTRAFLKVQDGCDYSCSFCTIPKARGGSRSAEVQEIVERAVRLSEEGFHEVVLSGVNVGDFGKSTASTFFDLLRALESEPDVTARLRISSIEPNLLTEEIIELVAGSTKFCPHFHIPMQSGSSKILRLMQRRYQPELYRTRIEKAKALLPNAAIGADVIAGFPGETDADFRDSYEFVESLDLSYLHVFTYSERPGTKASEMKDVVPVHVRRERNQMLRILSEKKRRCFYESQLGAEMEVILERGDGLPEGFTNNNVRVRLHHALPVGTELVRVRLEEVLGDVVSSTVVEVLAGRREELLPIL